MNVTDQTINILKNFASINPNLVFNPGNTVKTISEAKTILAKVNITEDIPQTFGIYDLNEFLNVIGMFDEPVLLFDDAGKSAKIADAKRRQSVNYFFSDQSILTAAPDKDIQMNDVKVKFVLSAEQLSQLKRASSTLGVSDMVISNESGNTVVKVTDMSDVTSNSYELEIADVEVANGSFTAVFNINNMKFVAGEYEVELTTNVSHFTNKTLPIEYWVALEKTSKFS